ncbi:MAG: histone deacetylase [Candidatus Lernaella stagnicola]|nr:histone deacetylase [Candidatus Lernaella stagnicola]
MGKTGFVRHPLYLEHIIDDYHPESPERLRSIYAMVDRDFADRLTAVEPRDATSEELGWIHDQAYIDLVASTEGRCVRLDPDTGTSPKSYRAALLSTGGLLAAVDAIFDGQVEHVFTATRPPGHHAEANRSSGFCLFNNVAVATEYAIRRHGAKRVMIYDWDLHHGNGTQHSFEDTDQVLYVSTHQYPYFPGTGNFTEIGRGAGRHYTVNVPLSHGFGDGDFLQIMKRIIQPLAREFQPDFVVVSAGYDTYEHDPLGAMALTVEGYGALAKHMLDIARECCDGRLLLVLEGGYNLDGLTQGVRHTLDALITGEANAAVLNAEPLREEAVDTVIRRVIAEHRTHWKTLSG